MSDRVFLDTNVLVYLFDRDAAGKQRRARTTVRELGRRLVVSTQVLQEFYVAVTRKLGKPLSPQHAEAAVSDLSELEVVVVDVPLIRAAIATSRDHRLSFWDALVIESASAKGCSRLLSEDLQHGRQFGRLTIENPFLSLPS
jgi:predicted nucleic acid-binding protein